MSTSPNSPFVFQKYINEEDAVREVLMALQGLMNIMLEWKDDESGEGCYTASLMIQLLLALLTSYPDNQNNTKPAAPLTRLTVLDPLIPGSFSDDNSTSQAVRQSCFRSDGNSIPAPVTISRWEE